MIRTASWQLAAAITALLATPTLGCMQKPSPSEAPSPQAAAPAQPAAAPAAAQVPLVTTEQAKLGTAPAGLGLAVGAKAPGAALQDVTGATVELAELYARGPVFLVFYRGGWCPFCNAQLHSLAEARAEFAKRGVTLAAISVDVPGESAKTQAKTGAPFPMLSDPKLVAHGAFQIVHQTSEEERQKLAGYGIDLRASSGESHGNFATPAIFYVDRGGVIRFAHVDEDYKTRPSPAQLLAIADKLAQAR
jgi:peroxiredoxin